MPSEPSREPRSSAAIDVLIPAIEKDLATLPHAIDGIRKQVRDPIGRIYVISPESAKIRRLCLRKNCRFVNEKKVLKLRKSQIRYGSKRWERSGWLYQQFLKFSGDRVAKRRRFLTMDADTVLVRPHRFLSGSKTTFYCRGWSQPEYFRTYRRLLGRKATARSSFVAHYMLFDKAKLAKLKAEIERKHGIKWYKAIMKSIDRSKPFGFSEFETYGNYVYSNNPSSVRMKAARNKHVHRPYRSLSDSELRRLAAKYRSLSFHQRKIYSRGRK
ncbi:hypothetical protein H7B90_08775 [Cohnella xylanilytica]|uniref:Uncharacterized protein n=1 Tax=Cohnella xylanilytica TaxID=557555 RepID=A0A841TV00_9BACL|nr:DUF6492 family protein [Cohnella xylanilytica]MBB6691489.1 hypothetical protein [Cohnella xylanilytica]